MSIMRIYLACGSSPNTLILNVGNIRLNIERFKTLILVDIFPDFFYRPHLVMIISVPIEAKWLHNSLLSSFTWILVSESVQTSSQVEFT